INQEFRVMARRVSVPEIMGRKGGRKISMLTAYDFALAGLVDRSGVDMILVGDSLAMVGLGHKDSLGVGMEAMILLTGAVSRAVERALVVGDMPFMSYQPSSELAVLNAGRFLAEAGARAVKVEGGTRVLSRIKAILAADIPVMGHIGLTPQSLARLGGFKVQGKTADAAKVLVEEAQILAEAGCFSIVLEAMPPHVAEMVTQAVSVPTIGIGAGPGCDGQVLVTQDVLGLFERFKPKFVKRYAEIGKDIVTALSAFRAEVEDGSFPGEEHVYAMDGKELDKLKK
ncbi:MAG: 3-methyl-2-oxobutanoate hydroxymethyltransferase, partial [Thermodesulfobacteriota bacterium]|nr:3-methyl-2-oxobutanoate hydroxymethyltransferase [Thermodesulfobacteriota bacterium]